MDVDATSGISDSLSVEVVDLAIVDAGNLRPLYICGVVVISQIAAPRYFERTWLAGAVLLDEIGTFDLDAALVGYVPLQGDFVDVCIAGKSQGWRFGGDGSSLGWSAVYLK